MNESFSGRADALLASSPLFEGLEGEDHQRIGSVLERRVLLGGSVLFRQGQLGTSLYIVVYGRLQVTVTSPDGSERVVAEIGRGETVGEMALFSGHPRSATVRALRDSLLLRLTRNAFEQLARTHPRILWRLAGELVGRLQRGLTTSPAAGRPTTLALVGHSPATSLSEFAKQLTEALARLGPTQHVDRSFAVTLTSARTLAEDDGSHESALAEWLNDHEAKYQFVVYEADRGHSGWTRRCLRQADRILFVTRAEDPPRDLTLSIPDEILSRVGARRDLVLTHPDRTTPPSGTCRWLEAWPAIEGSTHHVALSETADFDRLARLVTGHAIGLVLGGGGARGCPSPFRILASRFGAFGPRLDFPHILQILTHTAMLGSRAAERDVSEKVELYLRPELSEIDLLDFATLDQVEEIGYRHTIERLEKWRQASVGLPAA